MASTLQNHLSWHDLEFCVKKYTHYGNTNAHQHEFCELVFVYSGEAYHRIGENLYRVQTGDLFTIPPGFDHNYQDSSMQIYNILFSENFQKNLPSEFSEFANYQLLFHASPEIPLPQRILSLDSACFSEMTRLLDGIIDEETRKETGSKTAVYCASLNVFLMICRHSRFAGNEEKPYIVHRITSLMAELETHYGEDWSLEKMADHVGMSVSGFRQQFKMITGKSPVDYLIRLRIKKASEMLLMRRNSIAEIGFVCGFRDSNYFSRIFCRITGMTPRECRAGRKSDGILFL